MAGDPQVLGLIVEMLDSGKTPEEVCRDCPELLPEVRQRWQEFRRIDAQVVALLPGLRTGADAGASTPAPPITGLPQVLGYEVQEVLGHGGMGVVYKARHLCLNRIVALKMLLAGAYAGPHERARFQREAEAVAGLRHGNIVQVYDVGDHDGCPYFTMEFVEGGSLAQQVAGAPQPARQAAALTLTLAQAVHVAHQAGIVHRDLKPANILLTADGTPKVTDFGLARRLEGGAGLTQSGVVVGTPSYMAPEQARGHTRVIGPAVDVYALGAILYELLTGRPPFRGETQAETVLQVINQDPVPPSRRNARIPRDLETICLKCLRKEPEPRYGSAAELAEDLGRFLEGRPIQARPLGPAARSWRWARRNPTAVAIGVLLLAGVTISTWQATRATRAEQAEATRAESEYLAKLDVQRRLKQVEKANELLASVFQNLDPTEIARADRPLQAILVEKLDQAVEQLAGESVGDPLVVANLQEKFGLSLVGLGEPGKAIVLFERAQATRQALLGPEDPQTLVSMHRLALAYGANRNPDKALPLQEQTLKLMQARLGPDHPTTLTCRNSLGVLYQETGRLDRALALQEETLKLMNARFGADHPDTLSSMNNLAMTHQLLGNLDQAVPLFEKTLDLKKARLGADHPLTLASMNNLAAAYQKTGKLDQVLPLFKETLQRSKATLGPDHSDTLNSMDNLALAYQKAGKLDLALPLREEALRVCKAKLGPGHALTLARMNYLGVAYQEAGKLDLALPLLEETLQCRKATLGPNHPDTLISVKNLEFLRNIVAAQERYQANLVQLGPDDIKTLLAHRDLAQLYLTTNRLDEAEPILVEVIDAMKTRPNDDRIRLFTIGLLQQCLRRREGTMADSWLTFQSRSLFGGALLGLKKYAAAEPWLLTGYEGMKKREARIPVQERARLTEAVERLVKLYEATDNRDEATKWRTELEALRTVAEKPKTKP